MTLPDPSSPVDSNAVSNVEKSLWTLVDSSRENPLIYYTLYRHDWTNMDILRKPPPFRVIGRRTPKVDALDKVTGRAQFSADVALPRMLMGKVLRSPYAHACIKRIDTSKAAALPGVKAIITGNDLPQIALGVSGPGGVATAREYYVSREILARDKVLFHGHVVAAVAAISNEIAEAAVDLIEVEYDVLPHVTDPVAAMQPDAVVLHNDLYTQTAM